MSRPAVIGILIGLILAVYVMRRGVARSERARFAPGDRVRVVETGFWAHGVTGTIAQPPAPVVSLARDGAATSARCQRQMGRAPSIGWSLMRRAAMVTAMGRICTRRSPSDPCSRSGRLRTREA